MQDDWIQSNINYKEISEDFLLDISHNLQEFKKHSSFQAAVMTYIVSQGESMQ